MALATSLMSGPILQHVLRLKKPNRFTKFTTGRTFINRLQARSRAEAVTELATVAATTCGLEAGEISDGAMLREQLMPTGIGNGIAVPHARMRGVTEPIIAVGLSAAGIDFDSPDGRPAHVILLIITPAHDDGIQLEILADIAKVFRDEEIRNKIAGVESYTEFLALTRSYSR
jgi:mannitol/fructose-specific phosphotransferase system IIA component (Ntr-type)